MTKKGGGCGGYLHVRLLRVQIPAAAPKIDFLYFFNFSAIECLPISFFFYF